MTGHEIMNLLKIINCNFNYETGYKLLEVETWPFKDEYDPIFMEIKRNLFQGLCSLDQDNLEKVFEWAKQKYTKS